MAYRIVLTPAAEKDLQKLSKPNLRKVDRQIRALAGNPRSAAAKKLSGKSKERIYRVRVGDYQILYQIHDEVVTIIVIRVRKRDQAYRKT